MFGPILMTLMVTVVDVPAMAASGQVTATAGTVYLEREGRKYQANVRAALRPGDRVETAAGSGAGLFLFDGHAIHVGPETLVSIGGTTRGGLIRLDRGEVRATVAGRGGMTIVSPTARAQTNRGILRASATAEGTRFWAESGEAEVTVDDRETVRIAEGQESFVATDGESSRTAGAEDVGPTIEPVSRVVAATRTMTTVATGAGWTVEPDALRLAGAAADSRRLKQGDVNQANDDTALAFQASGQMNLGPGTGPGPGTGNADGTTPTTPDGTTPTTPGEEGTTPATAPTTPGDDTAAQPIAFAQANSSFSAASSSIAFSGAAGAFSSAFSSGQPGDAQQDSFNPAFPGNIHLITTVNQYQLNSVHLGKSDALFPSKLSYYSIGVGTPPTKQVTTSFLTGTGATPITIPIPHYNAYLINLSQYAIPDPALAALNAKAVTGISGLLGANPTAPVIQNATPLTDSRAIFNSRATFALGEFALGRAAGHPRVPSIELRRSDQDRQIIPLTPTTDKVTPNPDVSFTLQPDARFFPAFKSVYVPKPGTFRFPPSVGNLDLLRKAALTTLLASTLLEYSHKSGQTQIAIGGKVYDITGYHLPAGYKKLVDPTLHQPSGVALASNGPKVAATSGVRRQADVMARGTTLRTLGARPEATRSGSSTAGGHAHGPKHR